MFHREHEQVNIWLLEIAQGLAIQWIFGQNVAWCYADYADELLTFIRLGHAIWWRLGLSPNRLKGDPKRCRSYVL